MPISQVSAGLRTYWDVEHRDGVCAKCLIPFELIRSKNSVGEETVTRLPCLKCGGTEGRLISRQMMIEPPAPITCVRLSCLWRYTIRSVKYTLTLLYHKHRATYAENNRRKEIPEKYRTGEDAPVSILGLLWEISKLK